MTKPFCDICGNPAVDIRTLKAVRAIPERTWSGYQYDRGVSGCDGIWFPEVWVQSCFYAKNLNKDDYRERQPELCLTCIVSLLEKQLSELKEKAK